VTPEFIFALVTWSAGIIFWGGYNLFALRQVQRDNNGLGKKQKKLVYAIFLLCKDDEQRHELAMKLLEE
jgi:hypothetical protein